MLAPELIKDTEPETAIYPDVIDAEPVIGKVTETLVMEPVTPTGLVMLVTDVKEPVTGNVILEPEIPMVPPVIFAEPVTA